MGESSGMYGQSPTGIRFGPALVAMLVVLAGVAGTTAYAVVRNVLGDASPETSTSAQAGPAGTATSGDQQPSTSGPAEGSGGGRPTPTAPLTTSTAPAGPPDPATASRAPSADAGTYCPSVTTEAVADHGLNAELTLLRYVDSAGAQAWICQNADGVLLYQGHRKTGPVTVATGDHTVLIGRGILGKVDPEGSKGYVAFYPKNIDNPDDPEHTEYHVSPTAFYQVMKPSEARLDYQVTRTSP